MFPNEGKFFSLQACFNQFGIITDSRLEMDKKVMDLGARLNTSRVWKAAMVMVLLLTAIASAHAQSRPGGSFGGGRNPGGGGRQNSSSDSAPPPLPSDLPPPPPAPPSVVWPWLEDGAILCASRDDLYKFQTLPANSRASDESLACHSVLKKTGIRIIGRDGPSRSQVVTTDAAKEAGWTNAFLPANPPAR
jgi:hypothetical protein